MKTSDVSDAYLDYWTARAEGVPAADLELRANGTLCVRRLRNGPDGIDGVMVLDYSTNWALCGPILERDGIKVEPLSDACWLAEEAITAQQGKGPTAMIAICRAVVRAAFGDEVEDLP